MIIDCTIKFPDGKTVEAVYCNDWDYSFFIDKDTGNILHNLINATISFGGLHNGE